MRRAIESFLKTQSQGLPTGRIEFEIGALDAANTFTPCRAFSVRLAAGARLWGQSSVVVRCTGGADWTANVPVRVRVFGDYLVTRHALTQGAALAEDDFELANGDLAELPNGVLTSPDQAVGRLLNHSLPPGKPLRPDMLRQPVVVRQGQSVKVVSSGAGFSVSNEGRALNNASPGQVAQVRLDNGRVVRGVARENGVVDINY